MSTFYLIFLQVLRAGELVDERSILLVAKMSTASAIATDAPFTDAEVKHVREAMIISFMKRKRTKETSSATARTREVHRRETHETLTNWIEPGRISQPAFLYLEENAPRLLVDYNIRCPVTGRKCHIPTWHIGDTPSFEFCILSSIHFSIFR